jgi:tagatose-1,6-bisphosphate aldolase
MIETTDILTRIKADFGDNVDEVIQLIENEILSDADLRNSEFFKHNQDRIIGCIIWLANKNVDVLKRYMTAAKRDLRDVIFLG